MKYVPTRAIIWGVSTLAVLVKCFPFFVLTGMGIFCLLTAMDLSLRENHRNHWKPYGSNGPILLHSWLAQLGLLNPTKLLGETNFDEGTALLFYYGLATVFLFTGIGGLIVSVFQSLA